MIGAANANRRAAMFCRFAAVLLLVIGIHRPACADVTQAAIQTTLAEALARGCQSPAEMLDRILCSGRLLVGVRNNYPGFGVRQDAIYEGFDIDVAREIAHRLDVLMEPVAVTPANRIAMAADGSVDVVIATMGISQARLDQMNFVQPPYYGSHLSVIGPRLNQMQPGGSIAGRTICVTLGSVSNTLLAAQGARLLLFDHPQQLVDALRFGRCPLVAHDDTYFAASMADRSFAVRFEEKRSLVPTPWGIGVARDGTEHLARLLSLILMDLHRSGTLIALAQKNNIPDSFLIAQKAVWSNPDCVLPDGGPVPACTSEPVTDSDRPTSIAPKIVSLEQWLRHRLGITVEFSMLKGQMALALFEQGLLNTLILVGCGIALTFGFGWLFQSALCSPRTNLQAPVRGLVTLLQSSPVVLLLILGYFLMTSVLTYDRVVALLTAIVVIGLANGANAGAAMADAAYTLSIENAGKTPSMRAVLRLSATQVTGFAVNVVRGSAVASFIGTPELLNALTDIASVTSERRTTYAILLLFYIAIVMIVLLLARLATRWLARSEAAA